MQTLYDKTIAWLKANSQKHGEAAELMRRAKAPKNSWYKMLQGKEVYASTVLNSLENLGFKLIPPDEGTAGEVCFVNAKIAQPGEGAALPQAEDYLAIPIVGEAGAGPGMIPPDEVESWVLMHRDHHAVVRRSNLVAVRIGKNQRSMAPTLHPGDIALVDRNDWGQNGFYSPGNIFLVREPGHEGGGKVKRVSLSGRGENCILTFYSDNVTEYEPEPFPLSAYDNDVRNAIVGKVVCAWTDLSRK